MAGKKRNVTKAAVRKKMIALGVYKPEFDGTIERYVELAGEYATIYAAYVEGGYKCETLTATGVKKSPTVTTLESLRRDMLAVEDALGLTPRGLLKLQENAFKAEKKTRKEGLI